MQQQSNDDELQALLHFLARVPTGNASTIALTSPIEQALALRRHFDMQQAQVTLHQPLRQPSAPVLSSPFDPQGVMRTLVAMATQGISIATVLQVSDTGSDPFARLPSSWRPRQPTPRGRRANGSGTTSSSHARSTEGFTAHLRSTKS